MGCKVTSGIDFTCNDLKKIGGVAPAFWVGYLSDLDTKFNLNQTDDIGTLDFGAYGGLYRFEGNKFSHTATSELQVTAGGNKSYRETFIAKLLSDSTADDVTLQELNLGNDIFILYLDNNRVFKILGAGNGLSAESDAFSTGQTGDSDVTDTITLSGFELQKPLRFSTDGGYDATLAYIESFEL